MLNFGGAQMKLRNLFARAKQPGSADHKKKGKKEKAAAALAKRFSGWDVHEAMLADDIRMKTYRRAIERHVKKGDVVVDLGTGTGILSFFAARAGASKVFAIEASSIIETAEHLARANGFSNVSFIHSNSREVSLPEKVDVILQEQMADWIDGENMIVNVTDLRDRLLKPGGRILPNRFRVFLEPVQLLPDARRPFIWEHQFDGIDFSSLKALPPPDLAKYRLKQLRAHSVERMLATPEPLFEFDLENVRPGTIPKSFDYRRTIAKAGRLDGLCFYWQAMFDDDIVLDTHPQAEDRPNHWPNLLYRTKAELVSDGQEIEYDIVLQDLTSFLEWSFTRRK
jgi:protein arginine N-methyltransferase 1